MFSYNSALPGSDIFVSHDPALNTDAVLKYNDNIPHLAQVAAAAGVGGLLPSGGGGGGGLRRRRARRWCRLMRRRRQLLLLLHVLRCGRALLHVLLQRRERRGTARRQAAWPV